ncbi:MAG: hypothetical protein OXS29_09600 [bacterium]|nr:hypothetical protein [bacterium]MDE0288100.1 hypothetical protein [bacterium]MDE0438008.1 hypothetical protein [bacterium]
MGTRTVRLDAACELKLEEVCKRTGLSVSEVLRRGIEAYADSVDQAAETPYEIFSRLDLGPGGYAVAPAREAKQAVARVIREKHKR